MVKAGVYLVARVFPIIYLAMHAGHYDLISFFQAVAWIGALTAFVAATQAMVATELKKVWAYSTLSQIGYMMLALGVAGFLTGDAVVAAFTAALFHLISHAVFKAALFLSSGAAIHSCESKYMTDMGGIRRYMPITFASMLIASLALAGIPPLSGFWSKELVLKGVVEAFAASGQSYLLYILASATVGLTFFYSLRAVGLVFLGTKSRHLEEEEHHGRHVHEASPKMWVPYAALALASIVIGIAAPFFLEHSLEGFYHSLALPHGLHLEATEAHHPSVGGWLVPLTSALLLTLGGIPAYYAYVKGKLNMGLVVSKRPYLASLQTFLFRRWYINRLYYRALLNSSLILGDFTYNVGELRGLQAFNRLVARALTYSYNQLRRMHTGAFNDYALGLAAAMVVMIMMVVWLSLAG